MQEAKRLKRELRKPVAGSEMDDDDHKKVSDAAAYLQQQRAKYTPRGRKTKEDRSVRIDRASLLTNNTPAARPRRWPCLQSSRRNCSSRAAKRQSQWKQQWKMTTMTPATGIAVLLSEYRHTLHIYHPHNRLHHALRDDVAHAPKGIDPQLDPNQLQLIDPRNPLNVRRREQAKEAAKHKKSSSSYVC